MSCHPDKALPRLNIGLISIHPAPYRDATLTAIYQRNNLNLQVWTMFQKDDGHAYWNFEKGEYPNIYLGKGFQFKGSYFHLNFFTSINKSLFDVLVVPGYSHLTSLATIIYCIIKHKPFIFTADTVSFPVALKRKNPIRDIIGNFLTKLVVKHAAAFWVPGNASKQFWISQGVDPVKIFEGCYCLDNNLIINQTLETKALRDDLRKSLGISPDDFVFLMAGNTIPNRQQTKLVEAFKK